MVVVRISFYKRRTKKKPYTVRNLSLTITVVKKEAFTVFHAAADGVGCPVKNALEALYD